MESEQKRDKKHLRYYDKHREQILAKRKEQYEKNKDIMKQKVLDRYHKKKAEQNIPASSSE
jgi:hypothetical protein